MVCSGFATPLTADERVGLAGVGPRDELPGLAACHLVGDVVAGDDGAPGGLPGEGDAAGGQGGELDVCGGDDRWHGWGDRERERLLLLLENVYIEEHV